MNLPNKLTLTRIVLVPVFMIFVSLTSLDAVANGTFQPLYYLLAGIVFAAASFTDFLDGHLARKWNMVTDFGKFADPLADKLLTTVAFIYMMRDGVCSPVVLCIILAHEFAVSGLREAAVTATGRIGGVACVAAVLDSRFFMGSMSTAVGDKITRAIEYAAAKHLPLVIFSASGGARMQEGIFSLMQMAKTSAAIQRFSAKGGLYISVLTHPTTGGVTASFASLGDIMLAEPGALIGFAGPRVIEQTIGEKLPAGFQRSEFQMEHGFVDQVIPRSQLRDTLIQILQLHTGGKHE